MKESIIYGTGVLILTNFFVKILSLIYRGVLIRIIGSEGLGLSEMIMPIFSVLLVIASLGIPSAMTNLISYDIKKEKRVSILKTALFFLTINSILVVICVFAIFPYFALYLLPDPRLTLSFLLLLPAVIIITVFSAYRGYFQGTQQSSLIGKSQLLEQCVRVLMGIAIVTVLIKKNYTLSVIIGGLSVTTIFAEIAGGLYLLKKFLKFRKTEKKGHLSFPIFRQFFAIGSPLTLSRIVTSLAISAQAILIPKALVASGYSISMAASLFGYFSGVALTILHLPNIVTNAVTVPLIPAVAEAYKKKDNATLQKRIHDSMLFTSYTAVPMLAFIFYFAAPLSEILFVAKEAGPILTLLSMGGIFLYLQQPMVGILQGFNAFKELLVCLVIGDGAYIAMLVFSFYSGNFTIERGVICFILNDIILMICYLFLLKRKFKIKMYLFSILIYPLLSSFVSLFFIYIIKKYLTSTVSNLWELMLSGILFIFFYILILFFSGGLHPSMFNRFLKRKKFQRN